MGGPATTRLPAGERSELVLAAARIEFGERGYDAARLDDVAARAGVTKPIVYRHFGSKKDLYLAVLGRHADDLPTFVDDIPAPLTPEQAEAILDGWLDYVRTHHHAWLMLFRDAGGDADVRAERARVSARARAVMAGFVASQAPGIPADEVEVTAELLTSGLAGVALWWIDNPRASKQTVLRAATRVAAAPFIGH